MVLDSLVKTIGSAFAPESRALLGQLEMKGTNLSNILSGLDGLSGLEVAATTGNPTRDNVTSITGVWRALSLWGSGLAVNPLMLMKETGNKGLKHITDHPVAQFLESPSPLFNKHSWLEMSAMHLGIDGNHYFYIVKDSQGMPLHGVMIPPYAIKEAILKGSKLKYVLHAEFSLNGVAGAEIFASEIIHIKWLSDNGIFGKNPIHMFRESFAGSQGTLNYNANLWRNGAFISGTLNHPGKLSPEGRANIGSSWQSAYGGANNSGKVAVLEEGMEFQPIRLNPVDAGWLQSREDGLAEVARIYGIPLFMLEDLKRATFNNVEHLNLLYIKNTLAPLITRYEAEFDAKLLTASERKRGYKIRFDISGLYRGDLETMGEYYRSLFVIGVLNQNEIRARLNLNPIEFGDRFYVQGNNMVPVDLIDKMLLERDKGQGGNGNNEEEEIDTPSIKEKN